MPRSTIWLLALCFLDLAPGCTVGAPTSSRDAGGSMDAQLPPDAGDPPDGPEVLDACALSDCAELPPDPCAVAAASHSNVGCEYWAVDLDNEDTNIAGIANDAAGAQYAIVIANPSDTTAAVRVEVNDAPLGAAPILRDVFTGTAPPHGVLQIDLPRREVDGSTDTGHDDGPGTFLGPLAYHVVSDYPVVAYQFNPIIQQFSNDASLLISQAALDTHYRVLGWPTAHPIWPGPPAQGLPDHSFVTIVGIAPGTAVTVTLGGPIVGGGGIAATGAGGIVTTTLGRFDVLNLESDMIPGDLTGTVVEASAPVAVFSGAVAALAPIVGSAAPTPPGGSVGTCCTDHLEEQVFPTSSWGSRFVLTHSPVRSDTGWIEPDVYRILADRETTTVTTSLGGADASFVLSPGAFHELYAQSSFVLVADHPVSIEQILVSQEYLPSWRAGAGGDASMLLFPPYEQYRRDYVFLTPTTFTEGWAVISQPAGAHVLLDGVDVDTLGCARAAAGTIDAIDFVAVSCLVADGPHELTSDQPVGLMVYGYYAAGSYGYAAGTDLERINVF